MKGCANNCVKWLLFIFNLLFFIGGGFLFGLGIWAVANTTSFLHVVNNNSIIINAVYVIIAVGALLMLISFLGCCGAKKENKCMLGLFFLIILVIFIVQFIGGILAFALYPQTEKAVLDSMKKFERNTTSPNIETIGWNAMQTTFPCCGFNSYEDWTTSSGGIFPTENGERVPESCCSQKGSSLNEKSRNRKECLASSSNFKPQNLHSMPCSQKIKEYFWISGGLCFAILLIELVAMLFSCKLYRAIKEQNTIA